MRDCVFVGANNRRARVRYPFDIGFYVVTGYLDLGCSRGMLQVIASVAEAVANVFERLFSRVG